LENLGDDTGIKRALKIIGKNITISAKENVITDGVTTSTV
jgi:hypothetical protein